MNQHLKNILSILDDTGENLSAEQKSAVRKSIEDACKELETASYKLKETNEELEQKRKIVEGQKRELEIEAALESVRGRAMAMRSSDELKELVKTMFVELTRLDVHLHRCMIWIADATTLDARVWIYNPETMEAECLVIPYNEDPFYQQLLLGWKERNPNWVYTLEGSEYKNWLGFLLEETQFSMLPAVVKDSMRNLGKATFWASNYNYGAIQVASPEPYSEENIKLLGRFSKVFDLTYVRFLDLQKAEAQAREAKIEAALERVRARTMAMQRSDELSETAYLLFEQLKELDEAPDRAFIAMVNEEEHVMELWTTQHGGKQLNLMVKVSIDEPHVMNKLYTAWKQQEKSLIVDLHGEELESYFRHMKKLGVPVDRTIFGERRIDYVGCFSKGVIGIITQEPRPAKILQLLERFAGVFDLTYTRFLDLQNAEAQAREAKIEAALERVRARTMAMQNSDELDETNMLIMRQLESLDLSLSGTGIHICYSDKPVSEAWMWDMHAGKMPKVTYDHTHDRLSKKIYEGWKKGETIYVEEVKGEKLKEHFEYIDTLLPAPDTYENVNPVFVFHIVYFTYGFIVLVTPDHRPTDHPIFIRFAKVFEQTYTRFLDIQKAEAQAREARIEAALERLRSKAMSMQDSGALNEIIQTMYVELKNLDESMNRCFIMIFDVQTKGVTWWMAGDNDTPSNNAYYIPYSEHAPQLAYLKGWECRQEMWQYVMEGEEKKSWDQYLFSQTDLASLPESVISNMKSFGKVYLNASFNNFGCLTTGSVEPLGGESFDILRRFSKVFDLSYTRFTDIKQAEAQAREAKMELALERVRARAMAMHVSDELAETAQVLFQQIIELGNVPDRISILIIDESSGIFNLWLTDQTGIRIKEGYKARITEPHVIAKIYTAWKNHQRSLVIDLQGKELDEWLHFARKEMGLFIKDQHIMNRRVQNVAIFSHGAIMLSTGEPHPEMIQVIERFASVFNLTYQRFLDLQKAEAQTREAHIEAALERIRAKALGMQNSTDLIEVATEMRQQMGLLGQPELESSIIHLYSDGLETFEAWYAYSPPNISTQTITGTTEVSINSSEWSREAIARYRSPETEYTIISSGEKIGEWYKVLEELAPTTVEYGEDGQLLVPEMLYYHFSKFSGGALLMISNQESSKESRELQKRAAAAFEVAYTRFKDLQQAEAQAKDAVKQASIDRVRAEIASMRSTNDLQRITPLIWHELNTLGVPFVRCGVFIIDEEKSITHTYLSTPEGQPLAVLNLPINEGILIGKVVEHWREGSTYNEHWNKDQFVAWMQSMVDSKQISDKEEYQGETDPPESLDLHFVPFNQGMLYVGNSSPLTQDELQLLKSLAEAFSIAYARYEDFSQLEEAKNKVDATLIELKQTQRQLIQSEKMASLGELTAGIAHEIQNPLNFVNNFSDVSKDLVEEMEEALKANLAKEAMNIAADIKGNLQKICDHGKRADAIVKGMLQHSRASTGKKEPTDINALADEYLRLSYHGLRAKDKMFNANFKTELDQAIGKIEVVPEDIGRVLLNLYNNAFYAASLPSKGGFNNTQNKHVPTIWVKTTRLGNQIIISVKDNGPGIPEKILNKIFQPFFTTKPTGQGTGLGLSLSYDIIKAHGGDINVNSKEGEGSEFVIQLPHNRFFLDQASNLY